MMPCASLYFSAMWILGRQAKARMPGWVMLKGGQEILINGENVEFLKTVLTSSVFGTGDQYKAI